METRSRLQQWAPFVGSLGAILLVAAFFLFFLLTTNRAVPLLIGGIGVVLIAVFVFTRPREELREAVTGRRTLYGGNTVLMSLLFIGIVVVLNWIVANPLSNQLHARVDLTANKQYTLSEQTINVLKDLKDSVKVTGFFTPQSIQQQDQADGLLKEYAYHSTKFTYQFVDPQANPALAHSYDIQQDATLVFERGTRQEKVYTFDENSFTNAVLKVTQTEQPVIYFTTGHGELDPNGTDQNGLSTVKNNLQQLNYKVDLLNLSAITATKTISGGLPADTSALVIAGPSKPFSGAEVQRIKDYLNNGGRVLAMLDPDTDPGLNDLLNAWGIQLNNDLVLDPALNYGNPAVPGMNTFPSHDVTKNLERYGVFFPGARSLSPVKGTTKTPTALFTTTDQACAKTDFAALQTQQQLQCDPAKDEKGPFTLGYAEESSASASGKTGRLVVIGNATFATDQIFSQGSNAGNLILFVNAINWLAGQEQLIAIPPKDPGTHPLNATSNTDEAFIALSNVALIPLALLAIGGLAWWRRR
jgi:gliding motility-associatede transport system auxiliary component